MLDGYAWKEDEDNCKATFADNATADSTLRKMLGEHQILLWFHGGGLSVGDAHEKEGLELYLNMMNHSDYSDQMKDLIFVSVDYRLGPECPFPAAHVDATEAATVLINIRKKTSDGKISVAGLSAGGNLAVTVALHHPNHIKACGAFAPMLDAIGQSRASYIANEQSSHVCPVPWLKWTWNAYLNFDPLNKGTIAHVSHSTRVEAYKKWYNTLTPVHQKWADPLQYLSNNPTLNHPIRWVVSTNRADPLYSEGIELVRRLRENMTQCEWIDSGGSHWLGTSLFDKKGSYRGLVEQFDEALVSDRHVTHSDKKVN